MGLFGSDSLLSPGSAAPDFELPDQEGRPVRLSQLRGKAVVLYFYPKDDTPGCTVESCTFRDSYEDFVQAGAEVLGISADGTESHAAFAGKYRLPFRLLSDPQGSVRRAYGVRRSLGLFPGRVTFVIDPEGVVRHVFESQLNVRKHVSEALQTLSSLGATDAGH